MGDNVIQFNADMDVDHQVLNENPEGMDVADAEVENDFDESRLNPDVRRKLQELRTLDINVYDPAWEPEADEADEEDVGAVGGEVVVVAGHFSDEESDSGCEGDTVVTDNSELLRGIGETLSLHRIRNINNSYCANVSYFLVKLVGGNERKLCFSCFRYYRQRPRLAFGEYEHYQDHYKTKVEFGRYQERCYLCEHPLWQIYMTTVCVTCNHHKEW